MKRLAESPHGIVLAENLEEGVLARKVRHPGGRIQLCPEEIADEVKRLVARDGEDSRFPLRMIGLRELRSHNSWMHNSPKLMAGDRVHRARESTPRTRPRRGSRTASPFGSAPARARSRPSRRSPTR